MTRKELSKYIFFLSLFMFLILGASIVALIVKVLVFPESNNQEFILAFFQSTWLSISLLYVSKYIKRNDTKIAIFYDKANIWVQSLTILVAIILFSIVAELVEMIVLLIL